MYVSKRNRNPDATRAALIAAATPLFRRRDFPDVSAEEIVAAAGVTRGALYHHFGGKEGLFAAVVEAAMKDLHDRISSAARAGTSPAAALEAGIREFLRLAAQEGTRHLLFVNAPAVLGWTAWRDMDARYGLGLLEQAFAGLKQKGQLAGKTPRLAAQILLAAMIEGAMVMATSRKKAVRAETETHLMAVLHALTGKPPERQEKS
ncbi:MAG: TetR/AcrR family transcriptional regulator [Hyphomonas sp.]